MCLRITNTRKCAEEDIPCYKVLHRCDKDHLQTPYQNMKVEMGKSYTSKLDNASYLVYEGLHSFASFYDAVTEKDTWKGKYCIAECIIPKGADYYTGLFFNNCACMYLESYASDKLQYIKIVG